MSDDIFAGCFDDDLFDGCFGEIKQPPLPTFDEIVLKMFTYDNYVELVSKGVNPHMTTYEDYLNTLELQKAMVEPFFKKGQKTMLLLGSRGYGKTEFLICKYASMTILDPQISLVLYTREEDRGKSLIRFYKSIVKDYVNFVKDSDNEIIISGKINEKEPTIRLIGINGKGSRGRHPTFVLFDDPITPDSVSKADRIKVKTIYEESTSLSKDVIISGQAVHREDLYTELKTFKKVPVVEYFRGTIPALDADLEQLRDNGITYRNISANYLGKLVAAEDEPFHNINVDDDNYFESFNHDTLMVIDPAYGGGDDVGIVFGKKTENGIIYVGLKHSLDDIFDLIKEGYFDMYLNRPIRCAIEVNKSSNEVMERFKERYSLPKFIPYFPSTMKEERIENWVSEKKSKLVILSKESHPSAVKEVLYWSPNQSSSVNDGVPDALATFLYLIGK